MSSNVSPLSAAASSSSTNSPVLPANPNQTLTQNDFLKLLVAQLQYQDPTNPQSNTDMAAQLAQFTSLQQATQSSTSLAMLQANSLVGSTVSVQIDPQNSTSGVVQGVVLNNGTPQITVASTNATTGQVTVANYNLSQVTSVTPTPAAATGTTNSIP